MKQSGLSYPQLLIVVKGVEQFDDVMMVARSQDVDLYDVILQLLFTLSLDHFGSCQDACVFVLGLKIKK